MAFVCALDDLSPDQLAAIGPKARVCATLRRAGFNVPDGFVVYCEARHLSPEAVTEATRRLANGPFAVRSAALDEDGGHHSFAGVHSTFLNVSPADVPEMVRRCLASVHSDAARAYRTTRGLPEAHGPQTVLVQRMAGTIVAGVAFTIDPLRPTDDEMIITASWGTGETVVEGLVEPDELRVNRATLAITSQFVGSKACRMESRGDIRHRVATAAEDQTRLCLDAARVAALATLLRAVETAQGGPQDVEWCHDGEHFWVLQSRPVTVRHGHAADADEIEWSRTNVREVLPDLASPQSLDLLTRLVNQVLADYFGDLLGPQESLGPVIKSFGGRAYFNLNQFRHLARASLVPPGIFMRALGHADALRPDDARLVMPPLRQLAHNLPVLARLLLDRSLLGWKSKRMFRTGQRYLHDLRKVPMEDRSDEQLLAIMDDFFENSQEPLRTAFTGGSFLQGQLVLEALCRRLGFNAELLINSQLAVGEKTVSSQQAFEMLRLAHIGRADPRVRAYFSEQRQTDPEFRTWGRVLRGTLFKREVRAFLDNYGHRGLAELDWSTPRFREDPTPILFTLGQLVTTDATPRPEDIDARLNDEAKRVWSEFRQAVPARYRELLLPLVGWLVRQMKGSYIFRERNKFEMVKVVEPLRDLAREMAKRFLQRGWIDREQDYFLLTFDDVKRAVRSAEHRAGLRALMADRTAQQTRWSKLDMPLLLAESEVDAVLAGATEPAIEGEGVRTLRGTCMSPGRAEGQVVVMREAGEFARMKPGAIIVAPAADPSWTPLFTLASGVIVEIGGILSHAATVAREFGLPVLANCRDATHLLKDGERVRIDATRGIVERI